MFISFRFVRRAKPPLGSLLGSYETDVLLLSKSPFLPFGHFITHRFSLSSANTVMASLRWAIKPPLSRILASISFAVHDPDFLLSGKHHHSLGKWEVFTKGGICTAVVVVITTFYFQFFKRKLGLWEEFEILKILIQPKFSNNFQGLSLTHYYFFTL